MSFVRYAPEVSDLKTGDLVWPRADDQIVFFRADNPQGAAWLQRQSDPGFVETEERRHQMDLFHRDVWVGHVAWIEVREGVPWVVDATPSRSGVALPGSRGVATQTYAEFLADESHTQSHIWHGRLRGLVPAQSASLIEAAKAYLGRPYGINPFGFGQTDDFYCSKLIWHIVRDALGVSLEKKAWSLPLPWFTPWDVMDCPQVQLLYQPPGRNYRL